MAFGSMAALTVKVHKDLILSASACKLDLTVFNFEVLFEAPGKIKAAEAGLPGAQLQMK